MRFSFLFLFYRSNNQSNLQYVEIINILRRQACDRSFAIYDQTNYDKFYNSNGSILEKFDDNSRVTVVCPYENSLIVHCDYEIDLIDAISKSGYIQSAGKLIFSGSWYDVDDQELANRLVKIASEREGENGRFVFYTAEDFSLSQSVKEGINSVKFFKTKHYIGNQPAAKFMRYLQGLVSKFGGTVERLASTGHLKTSDTDYSVFIIKDKIISTTKERARTSEHMIVYDSQFKKEIPTHIVDEWKPFWPGNFTTPQPLVQTMLGLVSEPEKTLVLDPFAGSGSIAIGASQSGFAVVTTDIVGLPGIKFNLDFFHDAKYRAKRLDELESLRERSHSRGIDSYLREFTDFCWTEVCASGSEWSERLDHFLRKITLDRSDLDKHRVFIESFFVYRSIVTIAQELGNVKKLNYDVLTNELCAQIEIALSRYQRAYIANDQAKVVGNYRIANGQYGKQVCGLSGSFGDRLVKKCSVEDIPSDVEICDHVRKFDRLAVVCDPPYGVNMSLGELQGDRGVKDLYRSLFLSTLELTNLCASKECDLIMCSLADVKTGKKVPEAAFAHNVEAAMCEILSMHGASTVGRPELRKLGPEFSTPYFWSSEKALDREILHTKFFLK